MRNYYFCFIDHKIYTETEKKKVVRTSTYIKSCDFYLIGKFKSRKYAENAFYKNHIQQFIEKPS